MRITKVIIYFFSSHFVYVGLSNGFEDVAKNYNEKISKQKPVCSKNALDCRTPQLQAADWLIVQLWPIIIKETRKAVARETNILLVNLNRKVNKIAQENVKIKTLKYRNMDGERFECLPCIPGYNFILVICFLLKRS